MPTHKLRGMISAEVIDGNGNVVMRFNIPSQKLSNKEKLNPNNIEKVIFNPPATIIIFKDGTKKIVKVNGEEYDPEKAFCVAMTQIMFDDNKSKLKRFINKYVDESNKKKISK